MSMAYIRSTYGVPAKRGGRVRYGNEKFFRRGTITGADHRLRVRLDGVAGIVSIHPTDELLTYLEPPK